MRGGKALISDVRKNVSKEKIDEFASHIDSRLMRWGLKHSFKEGYTRQEIAPIIKNIPFNECNIKKEELSMDIWLTK